MYVNNMFIGGDVAVWEDLERADGEREETTGLVRREGDRRSETIRTALGFPTGGRVRSDQVAGSWFLSDRGNGCGEGGGVG